jgi:hypothetical protein
MSNLIGVFAGCLFFSIILKFIYEIIFIKGWIKIPINEYSIRRIKYNFDTNTLNELREIANNSVGIIPTNPFFSGVNLHNKIALIIYHKNKPIGFNVMFDYKYLNRYKCLHIGLVLIDKNYMGKKLQGLTKYNIIPYLIENLFSYIYISDLGRSASGLKIFNSSVKNSFPNIKYNNENNFLYKDIFNYFLSSFRKDATISSNAIGNDETFIIYGSNNKDGGGSDYLLKFEDSRKSLDSNYNDYIENNLKNDDEVLSIGKINIFSLFF